MCALPRAVYSLKPHDVVDNRRSARRNSVSQHDSAISGLIVKLLEGWTGLLDCRALGTAAQLTRTLASMQARNCTRIGKMCDQETSVLSSLAKSFH